MKPTAPVTLLIDPADWFERIDGDPSIGASVGILLVVLSLRSLPRLLEASKEAQAYRGETIVDASGGLFGLGYWPSELLTTTLTVGLGGIGAFGLYVGVIHVASALSGGEGSLRDSISLVGWGLLPQVVGSTLSLLLMFVILRDIPAPEGLLQIRDFQRAVRTHPLDEIRFWIPWGFTLWSGFIWTIGITRVHELSLRRGSLISLIAIGLAALAFRYVTPPVVILIRLYYGSSAFAG